MAMSTQRNTTRVNYAIRAPQIRVIGPDGEQIGVMDVETALTAARERGLDLVEISPTAKPPVCKIMDFGKYKYELKKKAQTNKKSQKTVLVKEVTMRPNTDRHDYDFKVKHILRFLGEGNKAKVAVRFRGREVVHADLGREMLKRVIQDIGEVGTVEQPPKMEGRLMIMIMAPAQK